MIEIPKELQNRVFRFVLLGKPFAWKNKESEEIVEFPPEQYSQLKEQKQWLDLGKAAFEPKWETINNYTYDDPKLLKHLKSGGNYGIICGIGNLRVRDIDNSEYSKILIESGKIDTFAVKTGKGVHLYYITPDSEDFNYKVMTNGETRNKNCYVVAPGSTHPNGRKYEVLK